MKPSGRPIVLGALLVSMALLTLVDKDLGDLALIQLCVATSLAATLAPVLLTRSWTTVGAVYFGFYWLFHFGILAPVALGWTPNLFNSADTAWAAVPNLAAAAVPAALFSVAGSIAYTIAVGNDPSAAQPSRLDEGPTKDVLDGSSIMGLLFLVGGVALWAQIFITSGASLGGGYVQFLLRTQGTLTPYAYLFISIGMGLIGAARHRALSRLALAAFVIWSLPAFLLGLRGEVLIPLLAFVVARSRSGRLHVRRVWVLVAGLAAMSAGSLVRVARVGGTADLSSANPLSGLVELGYSIRPMISVQQVQATTGDVLTGVATYLAPVERLVGGRLLGHPVGSVATDQNVFSTFISTNFGPIGGSVSAEAFRSGGLLGVLVVACVVGAVVGRLDAMPTTGTRDALVGLLSSVLLLWVRNDFTPVPLSIAIIAAVLVLARFWPERHDVATGGRHTCTREHIARHQHVGHSNPGDFIPR